MASFTIKKGLDLPIAGEPVQRIEKAPPVERVALLAFGSMVEPCREVADRLGATLIDMRFVKPLDREAILRAAAGHERIVTVEENAVAGGAGSAVNELLAADHSAVPVLNLGLADTFLQHGSREEVLHLAGLDSGGILASVQRFIGDAPSGAAARVS